MARAVMIQGAGSNVGKSLLVAGLCRAAVLRGMTVAPFKPQNMSNNAAVTVDGGEIGRAQALQALAARRDAIVDMNPILLKPESETGSQVIVQGKRLTTVRARDYSALKPSLMAPVLESFARLKASCDLVIVEGAGSPAEVNLRANDIANMGFARAADVPVILTGDIDRGGVIAQIVGTQAVLDPEDNAMIAGFLINKFRGDPTLFDDGYRLIEGMTNWRGMGVIPFFDKAGNLPAEDALDLRRTSGDGPLHICALALSRIANFDDLDPLTAEPSVRMTMVQAGEAIPPCDLVIIPGSKSTRGDLQYLRAQGWDIDLNAHVRRGGRILGICGGYQMLGQVISDPHGSEGTVGDTAGLGFLQVETLMSANKRLTKVRAKHIETGLDIDGYEIHIGITSGADCDRPFAQIDGAIEGARSSDGLIVGSYLHGMFSDDAFRTAFLAKLGAPASGLRHGALVEKTLDQLAAHLEKHCDVDAIFAAAR
jgi:adenosylcobyric acid synthase